MESTSSRSVEKHLGPHFQFMAPIHGPEFMAILKTQILHPSTSLCVRAYSATSADAIVEGSATVGNAARVSINLGNRRSVCLLRRVLRGCKIAIR